MTVSLCCFFVWNEWDDRDLYCLGVIFVFVGFPICLVLDCSRFDIDSVHVLREDDGRLIISDILRWFKVGHTLTVVGHFRIVLVICVSVTCVSVTLIVLAFSTTFAFTLALRIAKRSLSFLTPFAFVVELSEVLCESSLIVVVIVRSS